MNRKRMYRDPWDIEYGTKGRLWRRDTRDLSPMDNRMPVLDLGCGDGKTLRPLARIAGMVVGLDISSKALKLAHGSLERSDLRPCLVLGDASILPFSKGSFGTVLAFHVLNHLMGPDRQATIEEIVRVTAVGGRVHFRGFSKKDLRAKKILGAMTVEKDTIESSNGLFHHFFSVEEVGTMFSLTGLIPIDVMEVSWMMGGNHKLSRTEVHGLFERV